jgi:hypothetical protein
VGRAHESVRARPLPGIIDRYPFNSPWVHAKIRATGPILLALYFASLSVPMVLQLAHSPSSLGFDIRLYRMAADAWLAGGDPWQPSLETIHYAGPPPTLIPFLVLAWMPIDILILLFILASATAAVWTLRMLGLPSWWMLFPPIVTGIWVGNLNIFVIALLVGGGRIAGSVAVIFKIYAAVPLVLLGRWRSILVAGIVLIVTVPFLPWEQYIEAYPEIASSLARQAWGGEAGLLSSPVVTMGALIALILLGLPRAAWLAVPVLWPATQLHYTVLALPALTPVLAVFAAPHHPGWLAFGVILYALWERREQWLPRRDRAMVPITVGRYASDADGSAPSRLEDRVDVDSGELA